MSSAILYLAIVAIWACVLVPRWLRRSHEHAADSPDVAGLDEASQQEYAGPEAAGAGDFDTLREQGAAAYGDPVDWEDPRADRKSVV